MSRKPKGLSFDNDEVGRGEEEEKTRKCVGHGAAEAVGRQKLLLLLLLGLCMCENLARTAGNLKGNDLHRAKQ